MKDGISFRSFATVPPDVRKAFGFPSGEFFFWSEATPQSRQGPALPITNIELNGKT